MKAGPVIVVSVLVFGAAGAAWWWTRGGDAPERWRTAVVERTDVRAIVSSTGTIEAVTTVEVGTQVSGIVAELRVDYNDVVKRGELLARIDPTLLAADVDAADARLASARAAERRTALDLTRIATLHERAAATDQELETARAAHAVDAAEVRSAEVARARARRNLGYTDITAPIDGVVLRRDVDVGQTVNAGFSAPTLFVLVGDLARVRVVASVDEADIGRIATGQAVEVGVAAWPDRRFPGTVGEVRLDASLQDNVVTYPVVVEVENPDGKLLPGMTATVEFEAQSAKDVLCAPNAALRFKPESAGGAGAGGAGGGGGGAPSAGGAAGAAGGPGATGGPGGNGGAGGGSVAGAGGSGGNGGAGSGGGGRGGRGPSRLWTAGADGALTPIEVKTGVRGATCTEVSGEGLTEGMRVVVGVESAASGSTSPFAAPAAGGFRGGGF